MRIKITLAKIILLLTLFFSIRPFAAQKGQSHLPKVYLEKFDPIEVYKYGRYFGKVRPATQAKIFSPITGTLETFLVRPGDFVKKGQIIGKIKAIDVANEMRPYPLRAPINGFIAGHLPNIGQFINKHQEVISVYQKNQYISTIHIALEDARAISIGHKVDVIIDEKKYRGVVSSISENLDQSAGTILTQINFFPKDVLVKPGIISEIFIKYDEKKSITLPREYIHDLGNKKVVYTVNKTKEKKSELKAITVEVEGIFKGLLKIKTKKAGDFPTIVTKSTLKQLSDGKQVEIINNNEDDSLNHNINK